MSLNLATFRSHLSEAFGIEDSKRIVVGVSGGVDSVVLLRLLVMAGHDVTVCHVNYGLRGSESDRDEQFVASVCQELDVARRSKQVALPRTGNRQENAREARYAFFREIAESIGGLWVAVAHHQNDQVETVLMNLLRGAGPRGLAGMAASRPLGYDADIQLFRPLLPWSRREVVRFAQEQTWTWREDTSNASSTYLRNRLRHEVMPLLRDLFGDDAAKHIALGATHIQSLLDTLPVLTLRIEELHGMSEPERHTMYYEALRAQAPRSFRRNAAFKQIDKLLNAQPGKKIEWPGVTIWRDRDRLSIRAQDADHRQEPWDVSIVDSTRTAFGTLHIQPMDSLPEDMESSNPLVEYVPESLFDDPANAVVLRLWKEGDRFQPIGLNGTKLVSDMLTDERVVPSAKPDQLVLCNGGEILWLVGHRLSDSARCTSPEDGVLRLKWEPRGGS